MNDVDSYQSTSLCLTDLELQINSAVHMSIATINSSIKPTLIFSHFVWSLLALPIPLAMLHCHNYYASCICTLQSLLGHQQ